jgi:hypothetical protein
MSKKLKEMAAKGNMIKTPEQMAEEYCSTKQLSHVEQLLLTSGFLAGYQAAQQWISVKERLPDNYDVCIVSTEFRGVDVVSHQSEAWIFEDASGYIYRPISYVTHWMPLPKPPEDK